MAGSRSKSYFMTLLGDAEEKLKALKKLNLNSNWVQSTEDILKTVNQAHFAYIQLSQTIKTFKNTIETLQRQSKKITINKKDVDDIIACARDLHFELEKINLKLSAEQIYGQLGTEEGIAALRKSNITKLKNDLDEGRISYSYLNSIAAYKVIVNNLQNDTKIALTNELNNLENEPSQVQEQVQTQTNHIFDVLSSSSNPTPEEEDASYEAELKKLSEDDDKEPSVKEKPKSLISTTEPANIYTYPVVVVPDGPNNAQYTIGDLHANTIKLLNFAVKNGVVSIPRAAFEELVRIYKGELASLEDLQAFEKIINDNMKINDRTSLIRLIGDELADRGKNDYATLVILAKLASANVLETLISNHGIEFLISHEAFYDPNSKTYTPNKSLFSNSSVQAPYTASILALKKLVNAHPKIIMRHVAQLGETYKSTLKPVSYSLSADGNDITLFSHAPIDVRIIKAMAVKLGLFPKVKSLEDLKSIPINSARDIANLIDHINDAFKIRLEQGTITSRYTATGALIEGVLPYNFGGKSGKFTELDILNDPFGIAIWSRTYSYYDTQEKKIKLFIDRQKLYQPENGQGEAFRINYANGHDTGKDSFGNYADDQLENQDPKDPHIFNIDNVAGKSPDDYTNKESHQLLTNYGKHNKPSPPASAAVVIEKPSARPQSKPEVKAQQQAMPVNHVKTATLRNQFSQAKDALTLVTQLTNSLAQALRQPGQSMKVDVDILKSLYTQISLLNKELIALASNLIKLDSFHHQLDTLKASNNTDQETIKELEEHLSMQEIVTAKGIQAALNEIGNVKSTVQAFYQSITTNQPPTPATQPVSAATLQQLEDDRRTLTALLAKQAVMVTTLNTIQANLLLMKSDTDEGILEDLRDIQANILSSYRDTLKEYEEIYTSNSNNKQKPSYNKLSTEMTTTITQAIKAHNMLASSMQKNLTDLDRIEATLAKTNDQDAMTSAKVELADIKQNIEKYQQEIGISNTPEDTFTKKAAEQIKSLTSIQEKFTRLQEQYLVLEENFHLIDKAFENHLELFGPETEEQLEAEEEQNQAAFEEHRDKLGEIAEKLNDAGSVANLQKLNLLNKSALDNIQGIQYALLNKVGASLEQLENALKDNLKQTETALSTLTTQLKSPEPALLNDESLDNLTNEITARQGEINVLSNFLTTTNIPNFTVTVSSSNNTKPDVSDVSKKVAEQIESLTSIQKQFTRLQLQHTALEIQFKLIQNAFNTHLADLKLVESRSQQNEAAFKEHRDKLIEIANKLGNDVESRIKDVFSKTVTITTELLDSIQAELFKLYTTKLEAETTILKSNLTQTNEALSQLNSSKSASMDDQDLDNLDLDVLDREYELRSLSLFTAAGIPNFTVKVLLDNTKPDASAVSEQIESLTSIQKQLKQLKNEYNALAVNFKSIKQAFEARSKRFEYVPFSLPQNKAMFNEYCSMLMKIADQLGYANSKGQLQDLSGEDTITSQTLHALDEIQATIFSQFNARLERQITNVAAGLAETEEALLKLNSSNPILMTEENLNNLTRLIENGKQGLKLNARDIPDFKHKVVLSSNTKPDADALATSQKVTEQTQSLISYQNQLSQSQTEYAELKRSFQLIEQAFTDHLQELKLNVELIDRPNQAALEEHCHKLKKIADKLKEKELGNDLQGLSKNPETITTETLGKIQENLFSNAKTQLEQLGKNLSINAAQIEAALLDLALPNPILMEDKNLNNLTLLIEDGKHGLAALALTAQDKPTFTVDISSNKPDLVVPENVDEQIKWLASIQQQFIQLQTEYDTLETNFKTIEQAFDDHLAQLESIEDDENKNQAAFEEHCHKLMEIAGKLYEDELQNGLQALLKNPETITAETLSIFQTKLFQDAENQLKQLDGLSSDIKIIEAKLSNLKSSNPTLMGKEFIQTLGNNLKTRQLMLGTLRFLTTATNISDFTKTVSTETVSLVSQEDLKKKLDSILVEINREMGHYHTTNNPKILAALVKLITRLKNLQATSPISEQAVIALEGDFANILQNKPNTKPQPGQIQPQPPGGLGGNGGGGQPPLNPLDIGQQQMQRQQLTDRTPYINKALTDINNMQGVINAHKAIVDNLRFANSGRIAAQDLTLPSLQLVAFVNNMTVLVGGNDNYQIPVTLPMPIGRVNMALADIRTALNNAALTDDQRKAYEAALWEGLGQMAERYNDNNALDNLYEVPRLLTLITEYAEANQPTNQKGLGLNQEDFNRLNGVLTGINRRSNELNGRVNAATALQTLKLQQLNATIAVQLANDQNAVRQLNTNVATLKQNVNALTAIPPQRLMLLREDLAQLAQHLINLHDDPNYQVALVTGGNVPLQQLQTDLAGNNALPQSLAVYEQALWATMGNIVGNNYDALFNASQIARDIQRDSPLVLGLTNPFVNFNQHNFLREARPRVAGYTAAVQQKINAANELKEFYVHKVPTPSVVSAYKDCVKLEKELQEANAKVKSQLTALKVRRSTNSPNLTLEELRIKADALISILEKANDPNPNPPFDQLLQDATTLRNRLIPGYVLANNSRNDENQLNDWMVTALDQINNDQTTNQLPRLGATKGRLSTFQDIVKPPAGGPSGVLTLDQRIELQKIRKSLDDQATHPLKVALASQLEMFNSPKELSSSLTVSLKALSRAIAPLENAVTRLDPRDTVRIKEIENFANHNYKLLSGVSGSPALKNSLDKIEKNIDEKINGTWDAGPPRVLLNPGLKQTYAGQATVIAALTAYENAFKSTIANLYLQKDLIASTTLQSETIEIPGNSDYETERQRKYDREFPNPYRGQVGGAGNVQSGGQNEPRNRLTPNQFAWNTLGTTEQTKSVFVEKVSGPPDNIYNSTIVRLPDSLDLAYLWTQEPNIEEFGIKYAAQCKDLQGINLQVAPSPPNPRVAGVTYVDDVLRDLFNSVIHRLRSTAPPSPVDEYNIKKALELSAKSAVAANPDLKPLLGSKMISADIMSFAGKMHDVYKNQMTFKDGGYTYPAVKWFEIAAAQVLKFKETYGDTAKFNITEAYDQYYAEALVICAHKAGLQNVEDQCYKSTKLPRSSEILSKKRMDRLDQCIETDAQLKSAFELIKQVSRAEEIADEKKIISRPG